MKTIHRFPLAANPRQDVVLEMPRDSLVLSVGIRPLDGVPSLWVLINDFNDVCRRTFRIWGTGWAMTNDPGKYVGTFMVGPMVWHVFDLGESP
jgi:hypothetical protein